MVSLIILDFLDSPVNSFKRRMISIDEVLCLSFDKIISFFPVNSVCYKKISSIYNFIQSKNFRHVPYPK